MYHQCLAEKILFIAITQHQNNNSVAEAGQKSDASVALMVRPCFLFPAVPFVHIPFPFMQELKEGIETKQLLLSLKSASHLWGKNNVRASKN